MKTETAWIKYGAGIVYGTKGDWDRATTLINDAYRLNSKLRDGFARLGWIGTRDQDWKGVLDLMIKDQEIERLSPEWKIKLAMMLVFNDKYSDAVKLVDILYSQNRDIRDGYSTVGWFNYLSTGHENELYHLVKKDTALDRLSTKGKRFKSWSMAMQGKIDQATTLMESIYAEIPTLQDGFSVMGWESIKRGRTEEGLNLMGKDYLLKSLSSHWLMNYTYQLAMNGRSEKARLIFYKSLKSFSQRKEFRIGYFWFPLHKFNHNEIQRILN
jgi:tetratricopeptide (TPR) repeat protein